MERATLPLDQKLTYLIDSSSFSLVKARRKSRKLPTPVSIPFSGLRLSYLRYSQTYVGTPNSSIFTVAKEDHTLGNLLRAHLLKDPHVLFAGYRGKHIKLFMELENMLKITVPHPLFANFELRVQTDGEITPREALIACCKGIVSDLGQLSREFTKEFELRKMVGVEGNANVTEK